LISFIQAYGMTVKTKVYFFFNLSQDMALGNYVFGLNITEQIPFLSLFSKHKLA